MSEKRIRGLITAVLAVIALAGWAASSWSFQGSYVRLVLWSLVPAAIFYAGVRGRRATMIVGTLLVLITGYAWAAVAFGPPSGWEDLVLNIYIMFSAVVAIVGTIVSRLVARRKAAA